MTIAALPTPAPSRNMTNTAFVQAMNNFIAALPQFINDTNALASGLNALAQGGAYTIPYTIDLSATTDADPGSGKLRFDNAVQNASATLRMDVIGNDSNNYQALIDTFDSSTSIVKGAVKLTKQGDVTKFLTFNVTARVANAGYRDISVTCVGSSGSNPFLNGDAVNLSFTRTGDMGQTGATGSLLRKVTTVTNVAAPAPNISTTDIYVNTGLASACTLGAPTGTPTDGQSLMFRMKDNGTAQSLAYNTIYRAPAELALPSATVVGKWTYLGFVYNATDAKWDLIAAISNM